MPTEKIKITSRENRTRREDSKSREKDGRSSKRSSSTVKSLEDGKHKSDKYRGDGVDGRAATKRRDDSKSRSSVPRQRVDDSVAGSRSSRRSDATSRSETSKRSDRMRSTERSYKSTSNKYGDGANKSEERHKSQRRGLEKRQTDSGAKNIRNNLDDTSRKFSRNLKEDGQKRKNEVHRRNSTTKDTRLKNEVKILKEKVQKRHALNDYEEIPSTSKQSSYLSPKTVKENKLQNTLKENSDGSDYNYEDDFEDYESDFEEDDDDDDDDNDDNEIESEKINSDIDDDKINNDKTETVIEESEHKNNLKTEEDNPFNYLKRSKSSRYYEEQPYGNDWEVPKKVNQLQNYTRTFINFKTVQKQQERKKASNKLRKRGTELLEIITLDQMTFDLFELPPVKYDVYIRRFGRSNTKQVFVQTEYGHDEEIQTDEINSREKWTQIPPNDQHGFGGDLEEENSKNVTWNSRLKTDAIYLNKFVQNVGQMILHVLEEELADVNLQKLSENYTNINFSQGFIQTGSLSLLAESPITYLSFSNIKTNFLLSVHSTSINQIPNSVLNEKGIICIWNINQPLKPERILTSNGQPSCCCFGPENIDIVIAGMIDGSIALWDLQEEASSHPQIVLDEKEWSIRTPTYNTESECRATKKTGKTWICQGNWQSSYLSPKTVKENKLQNTLKENSDGSDYNYEDDFEVIYPF
ncbi:WD repeat-containing protein 60-like [Centruroides sculpturatus]|uniref:WD repeat-containing protein 60-like n=1 Tax=Centruroides sculpturatus TaxID=218467 RepID=UPI000C6E8344|nr:WD repeat-containing protein 60-like [Centruroides sculpturatus]